MNTAASDLTDGRPDYQADGRGNVYFSEQDDPGGGWYQEKDGLTQAEAMEYITGRMAGHEPGAYAPLAFNLPPVLGVVQVQCYPWHI